MIPTPSTPTSSLTGTTLQYADNQDFNDWFDQQYGEINVQGDEYFFRKTASQIVYELDPVAYETALQEFRTTELETFKELVMNAFPSPLAYYLFCTEKNYETEKQRLERLKDTWESIIYTIFALVVGECRHIKLPLKGVRLIDSKGGTKPLTLADFRSDRLFSKLKIIEALFTQASTLNVPLITTSLIDVSTLAKIRTLNQTRNEFSHIAALSERQAENEFFEAIDEVINVLQNVQDLQNVELLRYRSTAGNALSLRYEIFRGHKLAREMQTINVDAQTLATIGHLLNDDHILAKSGGLMFGLEPFLHYVVDPTGHSTNLCFYKRTTGSNIEFEVVAHSTTHSVPATQFKTVFDEIDHLLKI